MPIDAFGHVAYALIALGSVLLAKRRKLGWILRIIGASFWIFLGIVLGLSSIWFWEGIFIMTDTYGLWKWWNEDSERQREREKASATY